MKLVSLPHFHFEFGNARMNVFVARFATGMICRIDHTNTSSLRHETSGVY